MSSPEPNNHNTDSYEPRRSTRVQDIPKADGDTWEEKLVVCEAAHGKMVIRSFYRSARTKQRVWDEPPTGATAIAHASPEERREKELELQNLQAVVDVNNGSDHKKGKKGKGFFSAFKKKKDNGGGKKGLFGMKKEKKKVTIVEEDMDGDEDMQRAISLSMGLEAPPPKNPANTKKKTAKISQDEQEQLDIAKAISLSQFNEGGGASAPAPAPAQPSEEEMLQRVIEASRFETSGAPAPIPAAASMPPPKPDFLGLSEDFSEQLTPQAYFENHKSDSSFFNKKMPAQPSPFSTTIPTPAAAPYMAPANTNHLKAAPVTVASYHNNNNNSATGASPYMAPANTNNLKPAPGLKAAPVTVASYHNNNINAAAAALKPAPVASLKPPPPSAASFDPYAPAPAAAAAPAQYPQYNNNSSSSSPMDDSSLRKMEGDDSQQQRKGLVGRLYNKKNVQVQAGVV